MHEPPTHGIVHAGFRGLGRFVARKKASCNLIVDPRWSGHLPRTATCEQNF
jgi:hypothetical protein